MSGKQDRTAICREHLSAEGYRPETDEDGDLVFKREGSTYIIALDDDDAFYYRVFFPSFWPLSGETDRGRVARIALETSVQIKVAKVYPVQDFVWASVELFCADPAHFLAVLDRVLDALAAAARRFGEQMQVGPSGAMPA